MRVPRGDLEAFDPEPLSARWEIALTSPSETSDETNEDFLFHLYRGSELLKDNRVHEAKEELERALHLQPRDAKGQDLLAVVYFRLGLYPRAISIYEELQRESPRDTALLLNLALCYLKTGQPARARHDLEALLALNPNHARAWGYLGLACDRLGDLAAAEHAFNRGGHAQMAMRMAQRLSMTAGTDEPSPSRAIRDAAVAALEELDTNELRFAIAEPASDTRAVEGSWHPVELGQRTPVEAESTRSGLENGHARATPKIDSAPNEEQRPTLIVGASSAALDDADVAPLLRHPMVPPPSQKQAILHGDGAGNKHTLRRGLTPQPSSFPPADDTPSPNQSIVADASNIAIHTSGVAIVRADDPGFAARMEAVRVSTGGLAIHALEQQARNPVVHAVGDGQLVLAPRKGHKLTPFDLRDELCFVRDDVLCGWDMSLAHDSHLVAAGDGESWAVVQLRGQGSLLLETFGGVLLFDVAKSYGLHVRREAVLAWFGRLALRALPPNEAPAGQRGLIAFAGEGRVIVAGS
ncbi:MAG: tetratricopeptide repeat protein [Polyangiaceae bacterium]|nr:tetratricopeptide repeat protein [Polyangiaceae bacterium]